MDEWDAWVGGGGGGVVVVVEGMEGSWRISNVVIHE